MHTDKTDPLPITPTSLKSKLKNSLFFSCCFRRHNDRQVLSSPLPPAAAASSSPSDDKPTLIWLNTRPTTNDLKDEIKDRCVAIFKCMGSGVSSKHRRHPSSEFRYDPLSYSLNFEDDAFDGDDEATLRNFSSRLPTSMPVNAWRLEKSPPLAVLP